MTWMLPLALRVLMASLGQHFACIEPLTVIDAYLDYEPGLRPAPEAKNHESGCRAARDLDAGQARAWVAAATSGYAQ